MTVWGELQISVRKDLGALGTSNQNGTMVHWALWRNLIALSPMVLLVILALGIARVKPGAWHVLIPYLSLQILLWSATLVFEKSSAPSSYLNFIVAARSYTWAMGLVCIGFIWKALPDPRVTWRSSYLSLIPLTLWGVILEETQITAIGGVSMLLAILSMATFRITIALLRKRYKRHKFIALYALVCMSILLIPALLMLLFFVLFMGQDFVYYTAIPGMAFFCGWSFFFINLPYLLLLLYDRRFRQPFEMGIGVGEASVTPSIPVSENQKDTLS